MEDKRAQTLEALSTFIEAQRLALTRTQSDLDRLRKLRNEALAEPAAFLSNLSYELDARAFKLSQQDHLSGPPEQIDWSLFTSHDPTPLKTLAVTARITYAQRNQPHTNQRSDLSDLQKFVKEARRTIIDPILTRFALDVGNAFELEEEEGEEEIDLEEAKRERERAKIRELKKRKIKCGLTIPFRSRGPNGVFIRRDLPDESADVDISLDGDQDCGAVPIMPDSVVPMDVDTSNTSRRFSAQPTPPWSVPIPFTRPSRYREPSIKLRETIQLHAASLSTNGPSAERSGRRKSKGAVAKTKDVPEPSLPDAKTKPTLGKRTRDSGKPKSETYKQSWSVSEQHLLERLLEEIPEGEKNRWQKISRAMMGRRTPRQVASRVQKYFEKLKRFGVGGDVGVV